MTLPSLRMYEDQCKVDRDGGESDASSSEAATGRDAGHSPEPVSSPLTFNRSSRGRSKSIDQLCCYALGSVRENRPTYRVIYKTFRFGFSGFENDLIN